MPWSVRQGGGDCGESQWAVVNTDSGETMGCHDTEGDANAQLAALNANVDESTTTVETVTERQATPRLTDAEAGGRMQIQLITPGWGSSGYYAAPVLEAAARDQVFGSGTHMYLDHPTMAEDEERPERSVRDLAAVLDEDARWTGDALVADARVFSPWHRVLGEMADAIGVSVRAAAEVSEGEAEGRHGRIVERLDQGISVDFVTHAGRGGKVLEVLESASADLAEAVSDKDWSGFSASDYTPEQWRRACLIDTGEGADDSKSRYKLPVREPGGAVNRNGAHAAASVLGGGRGGVQASADQKKSAAKKLVSLYRNQLNEDPPDSLLSAAGDSSEAASHVPVHPAGQSNNTQESEEDTTMPQIEEARLRQLEEDAGRVQTLETERDQARTQLAEITEQLAVERAREYARDYGTRRVREANSELPAPVVERIVAEAMRQIPLTDGDEGQRRLDTDAFNTRVDQAREAEESYLSGISETTGRVRGLGGGDDKQVTEADVDNVVAGAFGRQAVKGA